jgi:hypothetical protein
MTTKPILYYSFSNLVSLLLIFQKAKIAAVKEDEFAAKYLQFPSVQLDFSVFGELRDKIIYELYSTEKTYLRNMTILFHVCISSTSIIFY